MASNHRKHSLLASLFAVLSACLVLVEHTDAQSRTKTAARNRLAQLRKFESKFDPHFVNRLSAGGATMFHVAKVLANPAALHGADTPQARAAIAKALANSSIRAQAQNAIAAASSTRLQGPVPVNDAGFDYQFTRFGGFTQSETSSAWCGDTIVAGFNDSGAFVRSILQEVGGASFAGVAVSQNRGKSFTGLPFLNPSADPGTFLGGDPVVVCGDSRHFTYASLLSQVSFDSQGNVVEALSGISVSHSSNGGLVWSDPVPAVTKDANFHFLDKEWMAIDPGNPQNIYVTYTDFGAFGSDLSCHDHVTPGLRGGPDVRVEIVASKDGGNSWGAPVLLDRACNLKLDANLSGTQVAVGPNGEVYVAYSAIDHKNAEIRFRRSTDGGNTFGSTVVVAEAAAASVMGFDDLQGSFRTNAFPTLAVDTSNGPHRGALYLVWTDASVNQVPDAVGNYFLGDREYSFGDIVLSTSNNRGTSWSAPGLVSPTPASFKGAGRDQFMAGVATDSAGTLAICYSDRRNDPNNFAVDHFCSLSRDQGKTFKELRETPASWSPVAGTDAFINPSYAGDYDTVSSDATGANSGVFSTFQIQTNTNPDVYGMQLNY